MHPKGFNLLAPILLLAIIATSAVFSWKHRQAKSQAEARADEQSAAEVQATPEIAAAAVNATTSASTTASAVKLGKTQKLLAKADLVKMAGNDFAAGDVTLGDYHYVTSAPKKGYIYLCTVHKDNPGSMVNGPWIQGTEWNFNNKVSVDGAIKWAQAKFTNTVLGNSRTLTGNDLPISHTTGVFPVAASDDAHAYDPNPNSIKAQTQKDVFPANPVYSDTPYCMGGEVGVMLSGVALFNGFDAGLRDAVAHELQDTCSGHPQGSGQYHYHGMSACFASTSVETVLGYAFDGFPITGPYVTKDTYLTTADLDECHGITSEVVVDGKRKVTYHYVMTKDFPYSASCFRGKPTRTGPSDKPSGQQQGSQQNGQQGTMTGQMQPPTQGGMPGQPPQEALNACGQKPSGSSCSFVSPRGDTVSGTCRTTPDNQMACVPMR